MSTRINDPIEDALYWLENFSNGIACPNRDRGLLLRAEIERLRASQFRWIPVNERMPVCGDEKAGVILAKMDDGRFATVDAGYPARTQGSQHARYYQKLTHWAPIPPLPELPVKTQEEKDDELWLAEYHRLGGHDIFNRYGPRCLTFARNGFLAGIKAAREQK